MARLAPSLKKVFEELNAAWPHRDKRTDGWIGDSRHCPGSSDHCADSNGWVHAIDIDKDGIDPMFVISRLSKYPMVVRYMNYHHKQYHKRNAYRPRPYTGSNPHTSHIHVSIERNGIARQYVGGYGIYRPSPIDVGGLPSAPIHSEEFFSYSNHVHNTGVAFQYAGDYLSAIGNSVRSIRSF